MKPSAEIDEIMTNSRDYKVVLPAIATLPQFDQFLENSFTERNINIIKDWIEVQNTKEISEKYNLSITTINNIVRKAYQTFL